MIKEYETFKASATETGEKINLAQQQSRVVEARIKGRKLAQKMQAVDEFRKLEPLAASAKDALQNTQTAKVNAVEALLKMIATKGVDAQEVKAEAKRLAEIQEFRKNLPASMKGHTHDLDKAPGYITKRLSGIPYIDDSPTKKKGAYYSERDLTVHMTKPQISDWSSHPTTLCHETGHAILDRHPDWLKYGPGHFAAIVDAAKKDAEILGLRLFGKDWRTAFADADSQLRGGAFLKEFGVVGPLKAEELETRKKISSFADLYCSAFRGYVLWGHEKDYYRKRGLRHGVQDNDIHEIVADSTAIIINYPEDGERLAPNTIKAVKELVYGIKNQK